MATVVAGLALAALGGGSAHAVPSFARQTGAECAACHIGSYGPHLTAYGIMFKLGGYTDTGGDQGKDAVPLSMQMRLLRSSPAQGSPTTQIDQASVYLAGRLADNMGAFIEARREENPNGQTAPVNTSLANLDLRYAREAKVGVKEGLFGLSLNNSPGVQDPIDANQIWGFPSIATDGSLFNPAIAGQLPHRVIGVTGYAYLDKAWYGEFGGYRSMPRSMQQNLGLNPDSNDPGNISGIAPYWRLAYIRDFKTQMVSFGLYGMTAEKQLAVLSPPGAPRVTSRSGPADKFRDVGIDATYQYRGDRSNTLQLRANYVDEHRDYGSTPTAFGFSAAPTGKVREATFSATYSFNETWSATAARMQTRTNQDGVRYLNGTADSDVKYFNVMWVPFGKEGSWKAPWANLRLMAEWLRFDKFNGASNDLFGARFGGPLVNARDLNTFNLSASIAF
jgi:hypothetical protein